MIKNLVITSYLLFSRMCKCHKTKQLWCCYLKRDIMLGQKIFHQKDILNQRHVLSLGRTNNNRLIREEEQTQYMALSDISHLTHLFIYTGWWVPDFTGEGALPTQRQALFAFLLCQTAKLKLNFLQDILCSFINALYRVNLYDHKM